MIGTLKYSKKNIADERLMGFLQTTCKMTLERNKADILEAIEQLGTAKKWFFQGG
jgi:hypothetical protein